MWKVKTSLISFLFPCFLAFVLAIVYNSRSLTLVHTCLPVFDWIFTQKTGQLKECRGNFWSIEINLSHKKIWVLPSPWMWIMNCDPCLWTWFFRKTGQFKECGGNFWSIDINLSHKEICVFPSPWMWIMNCDPCLWTWFFRHESCISWTIHRMWSTQHKDVLQICFARLARIEKC